MKRIPILLIVLFTSIRVFPSKPDTSIVARSIKHALTNTKDLAVSPASWGKKEWVVFGGVSLATTASVFLFDRPIHQAANVDRSFGRVSQVLEPIGDYYPVVVGAGFALSGFLSKNNHQLETALLMGESFILTYLTTQMVKTITGRMRPDNPLASDPLLWKGPFKGRSFYSTHTALAFSSAAVLSVQFRDHKWVPPLVYGLASLGGVSRIYQNRHWLSDVVFGAATGTAIGLFIANNRENNPFRLYPEVVPGYTGMTMTLNLGR